MHEQLTIPDFSKARVLVFGDLMLDRYWYGDTSRVSPEAPVPVVHIKDSQILPGGAANVAVNIAALGSKVCVFGLVGDDPEGNQLRSALLDQDIECKLLSLSEFPTITKLRVLGQNQQLIRMDFEKAFADVDLDDLITLYEDQLAQCEAVVLSDYAKGALAESEKLIRLARQRDVPVLVDPKTDNFKRYAGATLVTPNLKEFERVVGQCVIEETLVERGRTLLSTHHIQNLLVTLGKDGMLLIPSDGEAVHMSAKALEVYDVTGAGDTVIGVIAAGLAAGHKITDAAQLANIAASVSVSKLGAATVSVPELRRALQKQNDSHVGIVNEAELLTAVADARAHNERVVMTNGCFDLLHAGHVQYLQQAKALGDRLIVAVNSDDSVRQLKGETRPLNPLRERMEVIAALQAVDWVIGFNEETPRDLISRVLPDVLVKGADYEVSEIAGANEVIASGGEVKTLELREGVSTTNIIGRMKTHTELVS